MPPKLIRKHCAISGDGEKVLETALTTLGLSARATDRILKVARTIADLPAASPHCVPRPKRSDSLPGPETALTGPKKLRPQLVQRRRAFVGHCK